MSRRDRARNRRDAPASEAADKTYALEAPDEGEVPDGLIQGRVRGRGAGLNPASRFDDVRLHVLGTHLEEVASEYPDGRQVVTRIVPDHTREILNRVDSPDVPLSWTVNPYRGCEHGCIYCYARPGHEYFGLSSGLDFETVIFAKHDAPQLLRCALAKPTWQGEPIAFSGVTDCYQPIERTLCITRRCLEVCLEAYQPVTLVTKNHMVTRDIDVLAQFAAWQGVHVAVSLTTLDHRLASTMEPRASSPRQRLAAIERLASAGVPVAVMTAPIIPGLNDREIPSLLKAAHEAGARTAGWVMLRLPYQLKALFLEWLEREFPDRARHIESLIRQVRSGELSDPRHGKRMRGEGPIAEHIAHTFRVFSRRLGYAQGWTALNSALFRRPSEGGPGLFESAAG
ncbi:MAG: PA0069 family radical SAM protein [Phycisphaeraceae bacterium]|nr:PA0069 family radical SAM protein [Phycisphaeraceae bacterium]